jgi:AraC-like DNA-binding protein
VTDAGPHSRGHLNPGDPGVVFDRFTLESDLDALVRHVWVVRWAVPAGDERIQRVLAYPTFNAVFEGDAPARLFPPTGRVGARRLHGSGWGVGLLLQPCAGRVILAGTRLAPYGVAQTGAVLDAAPAASVAHILAGAGADAPLADDARAELAGTLERWLRTYLDRLDERDLFVNEACFLAETDASLQRAADLAFRLGVAPRTLERATRDYVGLSPKWLIECRRLQEAATTLYSNGDADLSELAATLGYADYAHLSRRYRAVLGETPRATRDAGRARALRAAA